MTPDVSRWQVSSEYDFLDDIAAPDLAWEWLRRNARYQNDFAEAADKHLSTRSRVTLIRQNWGLLPPRSPRSQSQRGVHFLVVGRRHERSLSDRGSGIHHK
jgi:hypothetical protein